MVDDRVPLTTRVGAAPTVWTGPWPPGWTVRHVNETGSTNRDLLDHLDRRDAAGARPERTALVADHQTAGRGRLDRRWDAPPGTNLLASVLLHPHGHDPGELPRRVALAAVDACSEVRRQSLAASDGDGADVVRIKWPNDLHLGGRKLAGVLAEGHPSGAVVVGIGINVAWCPRGAARLGSQTLRPALLARLLAAFDALPESSAALAVRYRDVSATIGRRVLVERVVGDLRGTARDVADDGRLVVVDDSGSRHEIAVGDVIHLRQ